MCVAAKILNICLLNYETVFMLALSANDASRNTTLLRNSSEHIGCLHLVRKLFDKIEMYYPNPPFFPHGIVFENRIITLPFG